MNPIQVILIAVGLSADAFAVSVAEGVALHKVTRNHVLRISLHFGLFQAVMPIVGWLAGTGLRQFVAAWDHWVAFGILTFIGGKMLLDVLFKFETREVRAPSSGGRLILLSVATSIDALAVGISLSMLEVRIWWPAVTIGVVTGILCAIGIDLGDRIGTKMGRWAELAGGTILCLIGAKILADAML